MAALVSLVVERVELDGEHPVEPARRFEHDGGVGVGAGHRFLAIDVFAGLQRRHGDGHVEVVVETHVHRGDVVAGEELAEVGVGVGDAVFLGHALRFGLVQVCDRDHLGVGDASIAVDVRFADLSDADDADANLFSHGDAS